jgi:hypothetical protein
MAESVEAQLPGHAEVFRGNSRYGLRRDTYVRE